MGRVVIPTGQASAMRELAAASATTEARAVAVKTLKADANSMNRLHGRGWMAKTCGQVWLTPDGVAALPLLNQAEEPAS